MTVMFNNAEVIEMQVIVHLVPAVAQDLKEGSVRSEATSELRGALEDLGVELRPMHPGSLDLALGTTFSLEVRDPEQANTVVTRLQTLRGVKSAYLKPPPALP
jgi:hypothetical protein